jgi:hypothetical protein
MSSDQTTTTKSTHAWLRKINVAFVPGPMDPLLDEVSENLMRHFRLLGHCVQETPDDRIDVLITSAAFEESRFPPRPIDSRPCWITLRPR